MISDDRLDDFTVPHALAAQVPHALTEGGRGAEAGELGDGLQGALQADNGNSVGGCGVPAKPRVGSCGDRGFGIRGVLL